MSFSQPDENLARAIVRLKSGMGSAFDFKVLCDAFTAEQKTTDYRLRHSKDTATMRQAQGESRILEQLRHLINNADEILQKLESKQ